MTCSRRHRTRYASRALHLKDGMSDLKQAKINTAKNIVRKPGDDAAED